MTYAEGLVIPIMICLTVATGVTSGAAIAAGVAARAVRSPAMMKATPLTKRATLTTNSQYTVFMSPHILSSQLLHSERQLLDEPRRHEGHGDNLLTLLVVRASAARFDRHNEGTRPARRPYSESST